jgi:hypothetical protein
VELGRTLGAVLGHDLGEVRDVRVARGASPRPAEVVDRGGPRHSEQPRLERTGGPIAAEGAVPAHHRVVGDVVGLTTSHDRRDVGHEAGPLRRHDRLERRVELGSGR